MTTACVIKLPGHDLYDKLRKALQSGNRAQIDKTLEALVKACHHKRESSGEKQKIDDDQLNFWLNEVLRLLFDWENALTRDLALKASEAILPHLEHTLYLDSPAWPALKTQISNVYSNLLEQARGRNDPEWHRKWSVLVRILDKEICQGAVIINVFLAIVESGFRSAELLVREQSFECWKLLVEIFAKYNQINIQKRIKLICIPLKSSKSKTEVIAKKKFEIWWFLINKLQSQLDTFADNVFEPFIYFCFGPSFKTPLCYYFDDSYQEFGAPGKIYSSIKQLSAIALIHMLGPAGKMTETLLHEGTGKNGLISFSAPSAEKNIISAKLFTLKAKLIINSCTECTVLFSQMKDKNYVELNRGLWKNLLAMVEQEQVIPRSEMLGWIRENVAALISLSTQLKDESIRELIYDTVQMVAQTNLLAVTIGHDSPEQLVNNYRNFMTLMFNSELDYPGSTSDAILSHVFDIRRYSSQRGGYWDMLQKTVQYLSDMDVSLLNEAKAPAFRRMITQIYRSMAEHLREQIISQRDQFEQSQAIAFGFLLYPLEYDRFLEVNDVRDVWQMVYSGIVAGRKSTRYACAFSEMIKAMTVAKYNANLGVILDYFRVILESVQGDFEIGQPPVKTLELFKDLVRKALVFQNSLSEVAKAVGSFRQLIERMAIKGLLAVIMPIRNVVSELVTGESDRLVMEVKATLKSLVDRLVVTKFVTELKSQPKEVKWNCKMLIGQLLELPAEMQKQWKVAELKKLVDICEGKEPPKSAGKAVKKEGEFVVIEKVWKFTPDKLTEHQRDRMRERRDDIPALYNDMSQSQDSFAIKPWTPNKIVIPADARNDHETIVMCATGDSNSVANGGASEASVPKEQGAAAVEETKLDKENNNGNVQNAESENKEQQGSSTDAGASKKNDKRTKVARELAMLKIDTIEGTNLQAGRLPRTRRSESVEPTVSNRRKSLDPKKIIGSSSKAAEAESRRTRRRAEKTAEKKQDKVEQVGSPTRKKVEDKSKSPSERSSPRKSLNFDNVVDKEPTAAMEAPKTNSPIKAKATNESIDEVIESSQANSQSLLAKKFIPRKPKEEEKEAAPVSTSETLPFDTEAESELAKLNRKSPMKAKSKSGSESPSKNTRRASAAAHQKVSELDTVPNTEIPETQTKLEFTEVAPVTQIEKSNRVSPAPASKSPKKGNRSVSPAAESVAAGPATAPAAKSPKKGKRSLSPETVPINTEPAPAPVVKSPKKGKRSLSPATEPMNTEPAPVARSPIRSKRSLSPAAELMQTDQVPTPVAKSPIKNKRSLSPASEPMDRAPVPAHPMKSPVKGKRCLSPPPPEPMETEMAPESPKKVETVEEDPLRSPNLSPVRNLDDQMEPLTKGLNRSLVSSPEGADQGERDADLLNSTLNISPISEEKGNPSTPSVAAAAKDNSASGSGEKRASSRIMDREKTSVMPSPITRRTRNSPPIIPAAVANLKARTPQMPPRSPSTNRIELRGRGAQLINLIRNQQNEASPKPSGPSPQNSSTPKMAPATPSDRSLMMRKLATTTAAPPSQSPEQPIQQEKEKEKDYLVFSKVLPSPKASPAVSILKRKLNHDDSGDDIESPANKRKRVSFHDPPVSITKEYIRQEEECRSPSVNRSLLMAGMSPSDKAKFLLRRNSKTDSRSELAKFTKTSTIPADPDKEDEDELSSSPESLDGEFVINTTENMSTLQVTAVDVDMPEDPKPAPSSSSAKTEAQPSVPEVVLVPAAPEPEPIELPKRTSPRKISPKPATEEPLMKKPASPVQIPIPAPAPVIPEKPDPTIRFQSEDEILLHVISNYSLDSMLERYLGAGKTLEQPKSTRVLTRELSLLMTKDSKTRYTVLDELSERHSAEFLDHAVQENSSAMVCQRLSMTTMTEYIFENLRKLPPESDDQGKNLDQEERIRILQTMFDNLLQMHKYVGGGEFLRMREQFVKAVVHGKSKFEVMELLEEYFSSSGGSSSRTKNAASSSSTST